MNLNTLVLFFAAAALFTNNPIHTKPLLNAELEEELQLLQLISNKTISVDDDTGIATVKINNDLKLVGIMDNSKFIVQEVQATPAGIECMHSIFHLMNIQHRCFRDFTKVDALTALRIILCLSAKLGLAGGKALLEYLKDGLIKLKGHADEQARRGWQGLRKSLKAKYPKGIFDSGWDSDWDFNAQ